MGTIDWAEFARRATEPVTTTVTGVVRSIDMAAAERVTFAPPDNWRVEDENGRLIFLANDDGYYLPGGRFEPRRSGFWRSGDTAAASLIVPRDLVHPIDDDFTRPAGPVSDITYLGRAAWRVTLVPPPHKPRPVVQIVDVASGITLAYETPDGTPVAAFTSVSTGITVLPDAFIR